MGILTVLREMAFEKSGAKQATTLPQDYQMVEDEFKHRCLALQGAVRVSKDSFAIGNRNGAANNLNFGQSLIICGSQYPDDSTLSYTLVKVGELQERLAANQHTFESLARNNYISYWNRFLEVDVATAQRAVRKVHQRRLEYDNYLGRHTSDLEAPYYVNERYLEAGRRLQAAMITAKELMLKVLNSDDYQRMIFLQFLDAEYEYYNACTLEIENTRRLLNQGALSWAITGESKPMLSPDRKHLQQFKTAEDRKAAKAPKMFVPPPLPAPPSSALFQTTIVPTSGEAAAGAVRIPSKRGDVGAAGAGGGIHILKSGVGRSRFEETPLEQVPAGTVIATAPITGVAAIPQPEGQIMTEMYPMQGQLMPQLGERLYYHGSPTGLGESYLGQEYYQPSPLLLQQQPSPLLYQQPSPVLEQQQPLPMPSLQLQQPQMQPLQQQPLQPMSGLGAGAGMNVPLMNRGGLPLPSHSLFQPLSLQQPLQKPQPLQQQQQQQQQPLQQQQQPLQQQQEPQQLSGSNIPPAPPPPPVYIPSKEDLQQLPLQQQLQERSLENQLQQQHQHLGQGMHMPKSGESVQQQPQQQQQLPQQQTPGMMPSNVPPSLPSSETAGTGEGMANTMYDFTSDDPACLSLKKGDQVNVIRKYPQGWWYGELRGKKGFFPESFVSPMQQQQQQSMQMQPAQMQMQMQMQQQQQQPMASGSSSKATEIEARSSMVPGGLAFPSSSAAAVAGAGAVESPTNL